MNKPVVDINKNIVFIKGSVKIKPTAKLITAVNPRGITPIIKPNIKKNGVNIVLIINAIGSGTNSGLTYHNIATQNIPIKDPNKIWIKAPPKKAHIPNVKSPSVELLISTNKSIIVANKAVINIPNLDNIIPIRITIKIKKI